MGFQYFRSYGLPIIRTRAFNHEGPRRGEVFVTSNFAKQVAGSRPACTIRPSTRVLKPVATTLTSGHRRGYWMLLERGEPGEVITYARGGLGSFSKS
jgi:GDP-4-dehydro-6-deoxy-D-mannose reductase